MPGLRSIPKQERSRQSFDRILDTAARVLDQVGLDRFNTNLLAERAGVRVRTVYRYFPDKYAVLIALAHRIMVDWEERMDREFLELADPDRDWKAVQRRTVLLLARRTANQPGGLYLLRALSVIPELDEMDFELLERLSLKMSRALKQRGIAMPMRRLQEICRVVLVSTNAGVETCFRVAKSERARFLGEIVRMQVRYLGFYL